MSSRNRYHMVPTTTPKALHLGTLFHEALAQLYLGANPDAVMRLVKADMGSDETALLNMVPKYYDQVLLNDLAPVSEGGNGWQVLEVEHVFEFPSSIPDVTCTGAIDLIVYDPANNQILGIEHKTCSQFRDPALIYMDEQPRLYFEALEHYIPTSQYPHAENGGIVINEVKKLLRDFQYRRTPCEYSPEDREGFWSKWTSDLFNLRAEIESPQHPDPSYWACQMCDYKSICAQTGYKLLPDVETLVQNYSTEYEIRVRDHLEEKLDWSERLEKD